MHSQKPKIRSRTNTGGTISFCVDAGIISGKRYRKFFKTKEEAKIHCGQITVAKQEQGALAFSLTPEEQVEARRAFDLLKTSQASLIDVVSFFLKHNQPKNGQKLTRDVIEEFLKIKTRKGGKPRYLRALKFVYKKFNLTFGEKKINEIYRKDAEEWLHLQKFANLTKRNYLRDLGMLFKFASGEGYCAENIIIRIEKPKAVEKPAEIFTVSQASLLLDAARRFDPDLVPYIAIGLFAGLRSSELAALDWSEISIFQKNIEVKAAKAKTSRRRVVEMSENLQKWLEPHKKVQGAIVAPGWRERLQKLAKRMELPKWPQNGLRHSFGSYHLAFYQNAAKTALELGHETTKMLFAHYRELVSKDEAPCYWNILPSDSWMIKPPEPAKQPNAASNLIMLKDMQETVANLIKSSQQA